MSKNHNSHNSGSGNNSNNNNVNDDMDTEAANLLPKSNIKQEQDIPFCGCMSVRYYQPVRLF